MTNPLWTGARRHSGFSASLAFPAASACLLSVLIGCQPAKPPEFTDTEESCLADVTARKVKRLAKCAEDTSGKCSTDSIIDRAIKESDACLAD